MPSSLERKSGFSPVTSRAWWSLQTLQGVQRLFPAAGLLHERIQILGHLCNKLPGGLIRRELPPLAGGFDGGVVLAAHHFLQNGTVEALCRLRQGIRLVFPNVQGVEALVNIPAEGRKGGEFFPAGGFQRVQTGIVPAQILIYHILQPGGLEHSMLSGARTGRFCRCCQRRLHHVGQTLKVSTHCFLSFHFAGRAVTS